MNLKRRIRGWIGGLAAVALVPGGVVAEVMTVAPDAFPARPITLIVPFPAGGPSDALARAIAQGMSIHLKQPIVVENISGAGGTIGLAKLVKSAPDGYTLGFGTVRQCRSLQEAAL
jgi:tripartite-type tricarboxylate transporter receptor subunit TctC